MIRSNPLHITAMEYEYDTNGSFGYFSITILGVVAIALTITSWQMSQENNKESKDCGCEKCLRNLSILKSKQGATVQDWLKRSAIMCWVLLGLIFAILLKRETIDASYNPYEILGISTLASEQTIKKHFRKLSILHHPDKVQEDKKDGAQEKFLELQRAYKALTDPEARKNWEEYGNPDGRKEIATGIALPSWILKRGISSIFILIYLCLFFIGVPFIGSIVWKNIKRTGGVSVDEMHRIYELLRDTTNEKRLINILCQNEDFKKIVNIEQGLKEKYDCLFDEFLLKYRKIMKEDYTKPKEFDEKWKQAVSVFIYSHIFGMNIKDDVLYGIRSELVSRILKNLSGASKMAILKRWETPFTAAINLNRSLLHGVHWRAHELMQLPYLTNEKIESLAEDSIKVLKSMDEADRRANFKVLQDKEYTVMNKFLMDIPTIKVGKIAMVPSEDPDDSLVELTLNISIEPENPVVHMSGITEERRPALWAFITYKNKKTFLDAPRKLDHSDKKVSFELDIASFKNKEAQFHVIILSDGFLGCMVQEEISLKRKTQ
eukprot:GHVP01005810.1.p1 GENE.GHVP01005810.1~~GHVP01005810.1.p1  ORF type:complete len:548 (+),score=92.48 GHVP01005810.1:706-2349(+)